MRLIEKEEQGNVLFLGIVDGKFTQKVKQGTPGATYRLYVGATGTEYHIYEIIYKNLTGFIINMKVIDGKYGQQLMVEIENNGEKAKLYINVATGYFSAFVKRLPNVDLTQEVVLNPYSFTANNGSNLKGITIYQEGSKLNNYYYDPIKKKHINLPETSKPWAELTDLERKAYYALQTQYLVESVEILAQKIPVHTKQQEAYDHIDNMGKTDKPVTSDTLFGEQDPGQPEL